MDDTRQLTQPHPSPKPASLPRPRHAPIAPPAIGWTGSPPAQTRLLPTAPLSPTVFHQDWWLDATTNQDWQKVEFESGGKVVGRLPFVLRRRLGRATIDLPMLTHFLGPAIDDGDGTETTRQLKRISVTRALIAQLPAASSIWMKFHRGVTDTLAFQYAGFRNEVQFTCEIAPATDAALWSGLRDTTRRVVRRAVDRLAVAEVTDAAVFLAFYRDNLARRGLQNSYCEPTARRVIAECLGRGAGRILAAMDQQGAISAAMFTIWDDVAEYYLLTTRRPEADNGAVSLLIWTAMLHASRHGLIFDLDGVGYGGDLQFLTRFGGLIRPRYFVGRASPLFKAALRGADRLQTALRR